MYKTKRSVYMAELRVVRTNKEAILLAGDDYQITLALKLVLEDSKICPYYTRVLGENYYGPTNVGL